MIFDKYNCIRQASLLSCNLEFYMISSSIFSPSNYQCPQPLESSIEIAYQMLSDRLLLCLCLAAATGIASHTFIFIRREWHVSAPTLFKIYAFICLALGIAKGPRICLLVFSNYVIALFSSMVVYCLFFHPLRNFPGPFLAGVTKLWHVYIYVFRL